jgi:hypothetical protein
VGRAVTKFITHTRRQWLILFQAHSGENRVRATLTPVVYAIQYPFAALLAIVFVIAGFGQGL